MDEDTKDKYFFKLGMTYSTDYIDDYSKIDSYVAKEAYIIKRKYGEEARITFIKGVRNGLSFFKAGYEYKIINPDNSQEDTNKIEQIKNEHGENAANAFYAGIIYAFCKKLVNQNDIPVKRY